MSKWSDQTTRVPIISKTYMRMPPQHVTTGMSHTQLQHSVLSLDVVAARFVEPRPTLLTRLQCGACRKLQ